MELLDVSEQGKPASNFNSQFQIINKKIHLSGN